MSSVRRATASCQICLEAFGHIEDFKAPYALVCGHAYCIRCLTYANLTHCPLCGTPYNEQANVQRLLETQITGNSGPSGLEPLRDDGSLEGNRLKESIARVDDWTPLARIQQLYAECRRFLDLQPRNRFKDLETNVKLLACILNTKTMLQHQSHLVNSLTDHIHDLTADKEGLEEDVSRLMASRSEAMGALNHINSHLADQLRSVPEYGLLIDEIMEMRKELNDLRATFHAFRDRSQTPSIDGSSSTPLSSSHSSMSRSQSSTPAEEIIRAPIPIKPHSLRQFVKHSNSVLETYTFQAVSDVRTTDSSQSDTLQQNQESKDMLQRTGYVPHGGGGPRSQNDTPTTSSTSELSAYSTAHSNGPTPSRITPSSFSSPQANTWLSSSLTLLKTPDCTRLDQLQTRLQDLLKDAEELSTNPESTNSPCSTTAAPVILSPALTAAASELLETTASEIAQITTVTTTSAIVPSKPPWGTVDETEPPTEGDSLTLVVDNAIQDVSTARVSQQFVEDMRVCLMQAVARAFVHLVAEIPSLSAAASRLAATYADAGGATPFTNPEPLAEERGEVQRNSDAEHLSPRFSYFTNLHQTSTLS